MKHYTYIDNRLCSEGIPLSTIAKRVGTPCFVYSEAALADNWEAFSQALAGTPHQLCYAVKANANLAIIDFFARKKAGFDIVSIGELERVLAVKGDPKRMVFSGVGKRADEMRRALQVGIGCFDVESLPELERLNTIAAEQSVIAPVALRVNPDVDAETHPYIATGLKTNKFGIDYDVIFAICQQIKAMSHIHLKGIACHIGSQLTSLAPFAETAERMHALFTQLTKAGFSITHVNLGGGLGVDYQQEVPPSIEDYVRTISAPFAQSSVNLVLEPGRALVANTGILLTRIEYIKKTAHKNFLIVDAGMNDFMRPALYNAWHEIVPLVKREGQAEAYDVVGPVCESSDVFARDRQLVVEAGDMIAIKMVGAYGFCMGSNYNSRPRAAEVMIKQGKSYLIRQRETVQELFAKEYVATVPMSDCYDSDA